MLKISTPNLRANFSINDKKQKEETEILKIDRAVRKEFNLPYRSGQMVQPWYAEKYDQELKEIKGKVGLEFPFYIKDEIKEEIELVIERPENFKIKINNNLLNAKDVQAWWVDKCFKRIKIAKEYLKTGKNIVSLEVDFHKGIDLEAIYLIGDFSVEIKETKKTLTTLPKQINIGDLTKQGLPFYSGIVTYQLDLKDYLKEKKQGNKVFLEVPEFEATCIKVKGRDKEKMIAWQPYESDITELISENETIELDCILSRRNTFGPLHQVPLYTGHMDLIIL